MSVLAQSTPVNYSESTPAQPRLVHSTESISAQHSPAQSGLECLALSIHVWAQFRTLGLCTGLEHSMCIGSCSAVGLLCSCLGSMAVQMLLAPCGCIVCSPDTFSLLVCSYIQQLCNSMLYRSCVALAPSLSVVQLTVQQFTVVLYRWCTGM